MASYINKYSLHPILTLLSSNILGVVVGGVFFLAASLSFDLKEMGFYTVAISVQWIAAGVIGTGLSVAIIRVSTDYLITGERAAAAGMVGAAYVAAGTVSVFAATICLGLTQLTAKQPLLSGGILALVFLWAGARSMIDCLRSGLLIQQQYTRVGLLMILSTITGLAAFGTVVLIGPLTLKRILIAHVFGLGLGAILGIRLLLPLWKSGIHFSKKRFINLLKYARWPSLSEGTYLLQVNIGPILLSSISGAEQAGLFGLGRYPAFLFGIVAISLYQYWLPEATRENNPEKLIRFLRRQMCIAGVVGVGMIIGAVAVKPLLPMLGKNFAAASNLFVLNTLDFVIYLIIRPIESVYHGLYKPHLEFILRVARLPILVGLGLILSAMYGAVGMVWAHVISGIAVMGLSIWLLCRHLGSCPYIWNIMTENNVGFLNK
jgi:O-antigen/teichoic acid export membrane protein